MLQIKSGVRVQGLRAEMLVALMVLQGVFDKEQSELVITSVSEATHSSGSLHYVGLAVDLRLPAPRVLMDVLTSARAALGVDYDVVLEGNHIHVEFQPKSGLNI